MAQVSGPIEYLIVEFRGNQFQGELIPALSDLIDRGLIRILDLAIIHKDAGGNVLLFEASELADKVSQELARLEGEHAALFSESDLRMAAEDLDPDSTSAAILFENVWATRFAQAIRSAGGEVMLNVRIPNAVIEEVQQELV